MGKLQEMAENKVILEEERVAKLKEKELVKARRAREKLIVANAKDRRAAEKEAQKIAKQNWTKSTIREGGKRMKTLVKSGYPHLNNRPRLCFKL